MHNQPAQSRHRRIQVRTNAFLVTQLPTKEYYMYDVVFQPPIPQMPKRNRLFHHLQTTVAPGTFNPRLVYDGRSIAYSPGKMDLGGNSGITFNVMLGRQDQPPVGARNSYQIRFNLTSSPPIHPQHVKDILQDKTISQRSTTAINVMQLIVRQGPNQHHTNNGRAYFTGKERISIGGGVELWRGIFQSIRPTFDGMALTIDTSAAVVYKDGPLISVAMDYLGLRDIRRLMLSESDPDYKRLEKFLKKLRVKVKTGANGSKSRIQTIRGLEATGGEYQFQREETGDMLSVAQYFKEAYGIHIQHPRIVGISLSGRQGSGKIVVPMELCEVERGQLYKHKVREEAVSAMVKFSTMKPEEKLKKITDAANEYNQSGFISESGMKLDTSPMQIGAKLLPPPRVQYGQQALDVRNGSWNVVRQKFFKPGELLSWAIVNFEQRGINIRTCQKMIQDIRETCQSLGMNINPPHDIYPGGPDVNLALNDAMRQIVGKLGPDAKNYAYQTVLFIILPEHAAALRVGVKQWGDSHNGVRTQCLRENKVIRANSQYWNNVMLKINPRVGGINCTSITEAMKDLMKDPFIIMGADVSHPGPGVPKPSVSSLVYSHDRFGVQYACQWDFQNPRQENIEDLKHFVTTAVNNWGTKNNAAPKRIIFFRDGLSEGEFDKVAIKEIEDIQAAIRDAWTMNKVKAPLPLLTFIVVGKRHHAVFFPMSFGDQSQCDKNGNCNAGSVFDLRHPALNDFYLQSHAPIQGTCRSSHYIVLRNDNSDLFPLERLQELAYSLCTVYAKATRSVSIPAPVYYADSVCSRGPFHINASMSLSFDDGMSTSSGEVNFDLDAWKAAKLKTNARIEKEMYFL